MTDHRALIKATKAGHYQYAGGDWCRCGFPLPCLTTRLAEALEQEQIEAHETAVRLVGDVSAALARAETAERERDEALSRGADMLTAETARSSALSRDLAAARQDLEKAERMLQANGIGTSGCFPSLNVPPTPQRPHPGRNPRRTGL